MRLEDIIKNFSGRVKESLGKKLDKEQIKYSAYIAVSRFPIFSVPYRTYKAFRTLEFIYPNNKLARAMSKPIAAAIGAVAAGAGVIGLYFLLNHPLESQDYINTGVNYELIKMEDVTNYNGQPAIEGQMIWYSNGQEHTQNVIIIDKNSFTMDALTQYVQSMNQESNQVVGQVDPLNGQTITSNETIIPVIIIYSPNDKVPVTPQDGFYVIDLSNIGKANYEFLGIPQYGLDKFIEGLDSGNYNLYSVPGNSPLYNQPSIPGTELYVIRVYQHNAYDFGGAGMLGYNNTLIPYGIGGGPLSAGVNGILNNLSNPPEFYNGTS
ncbi:hypothetical protein [Saccharolobus islandicus]|uniref:Uncharacterized protein n=1 Tax=Saccharolobus islandicus (strain L.D.8.5 / Lassen \|nr:hypothetical protein [Sulfolobus islandicus]ADB86560.1 hypothetical protein LD85_0848 [Sulfolobus islandicus L.D.8.5]